MKKWKCVCGYIHDGEQAAGECPKCGAASGQFKPLDDKAADAIERSRRANMLHFRIVDLARQIERACKDGIEDALDKSCVEVFRKTLAASYDMMKLSMTELQDHTREGKWG